MLSQICVSIIFNIWHAAKYVKRVLPDTRSKLDAFLNRHPRIGEVLATAMSSVEVHMLDVFNFIDARISKYFKIRIMRTILKDRWGARVIPLDINIPVETQFLPTQEISEIVSRSSVFAIGKCYCRTKHHRCDNPTATCILLGSKAGRSLREVPYRTKVFTRVSKEKILNVLKDCDDKGLVHQVIFFPSPDFYYVICNCCTCCCEVLHDYKRFLSPRIVKSDFIEHTAADRCKNCGTCVGACPFDARMIDRARQLQVNQDMCFGCGLCVKKCPARAITLQKRDEQGR